MGEEKERAYRERASPSLHQLPLTCTEITLSNIRSTVVTVQRRTHVLTLAQNGQVVLEKTITGVSRILVSTSPFKSPMVSGTILGTLLSDGTPPCSPDRFSLPVGLRPIYTGEVQSDVSTFAM